MEETKVDTRCTQCGKVFRVGRANLGRKAKCTQCGTVFELQAGASQAARPDGDGLCSICQTAMDGSSPTTACPDCKAAYHQECWDYNKGCAVYGCSRVPPTEHRETLEIPTSYWGKEDKNCPNCGQVILAAAVRCRHCGATFDTAAPLARSDFYQNAAVKQNIPAVKRASVWLLVFSLLTCTAPIAAIVGSIWYYNHRREIAAAPAMHAAICKIAVGLAIVQTALVFTFTLIYGLSGG